MTRPPSDLAGALAQIKSGVRSARGYDLQERPAARKLNQNENPFDWPPALKQALAARLVAEPWNRYPGFVPEDITQAIARRHEWEPAGVLVGNGSNELIQAVVAVTVREGDQVVAPSPTFSLYELSARVAGGTYTAVPLGSDFSVDLPRFLAAVPAARLVVLCTPNNPTGTVWGSDQVEQVLAATSGLVVVDEAYQEFGGVSMLPVLRRSARVIVLRTLSKAFGLAGLRFGYALAHPAVAREIAKGKLPYNVNRFTLEAAKAALAREAELRPLIASLVDRRDRTARAMQAIPGLTVFPSAANFLLFRSDRIPAETLFRELLDRSSILVRDVSTGPGLAGCLRVTIGTEEDMDAFLASLREILA